jgi:hypothetical protein
VGGGFWPSYFATLGHDMLLAEIDSQRSNLRVKILEETNTRLKGSCLCGRVNISVPDRFAYFAACHCSQCRKFSGSAFSAVAAVPYDDFEVVSGEKYIKYFVKSESGTLAFCSNCGSSLYGKRSNIKMIHLRAGILDDVPSQQLSYHVFAASKASWFSISDDLRQFDGLPQKRKPD